MENYLRSQWWHTITHIGINSNTPVSEVKNIKVMNQIAGITCVLLTLITLQDLYFGKFDQVAVDSFLNFALGYSIYLNYQRKYDFAKKAFCIIYPFLIFLVAICYGKKMNMDCTFIVSIISSIIFFHSKKKQYFYISISVFFLVFSNVFLHFHEPLIDFPTTRIDELSGVILTLIGTYLITLMYKNETAKNENQLLLSLDNIEKQNRELNIVNQELERFAYIASHDLKTPIRTIVSFLDLIKKKIEKQEYDNLAYYIDFAHKGGVQMNRLVSEILEFSKLNMSYELELENIDLNQLLSNIKEQLDSFIREKKGIVLAENLPIIRSNSLLVNILFQNLIENGLKYNSSEQPIVKISAKEMVNGVELSFEDNGIGINEAFHDKIFQLFTRLHTEKEFSGSGMGLAISHKIVEKIGGKINLVSKENEGTTFIVFLPN
jgi:signal transduction histidine kinase